MRKRTWLTAAAVAAATALGTGASIAAEKKVPEFGTWQYQEALETGTLPSAIKAMEAGPDAAGKPELPTIEVGGVKYRIGLDTH
jgi:hypothetical protein